MANANQTAAEKPAEKKPAPVMRVVDTTAVPFDELSKRGGPRTHVLVVDGLNKSFTFQPHEAKELPPAIAVRFLKDEAFKLVDKEGNPIEYRRRPRLPEELGAGERLAVADDEVIARLEELTDKALQLRALELTGGEKFAEAANRADMIAFLTEHRKKRAKANAAPPEVGGDTFTPEPELDDEAA